MVVPLQFQHSVHISFQLTLRAWIHTEDSKRRTLQRNDIAMAVHKFDQVCLPAKIFFLLFKIKEEIFFGEFFLPFYYLLK